MEPEAKAEYPCEFQQLVALKKEVDVLKQDRLEWRQELENLKAELEKNRLEQSTRLDSLERQLDSRLRTLNTAVDNKLCCAELELQERMELKESSIVAQFLERFKVVDELLNKIVGDIVKLAPTIDRKASLEEDRTAQDIHGDVTCGACGRHVTGVRYLCLQCGGGQGADACESCVLDGAAAHHCHVALRIAQPCDSSDATALLAPLAAAFRRCPLAAPEAAAVGLHSAYCDGCRTTVMGFRYHCLVCADFDLCEPCEQERHHRQHWMLRLPWSGSELLEGAVQQAKKMFQHK